MGLRLRLAYINSSPPSVAYMRRWIRSALVLIMACRLYGAKPLSSQMLCYCQLDPKEQTSVIKVQHFSFTKMYLKISSAKWRPFCPGVMSLRNAMMNRLLTTKLRKALSWEFVVMALWHMIRLVFSYGDPDGSYWSRWLSLCKYDFKRL